MLDLHCHILPGVDDGPKTLEESLAVADQCARDGITHIIATPHCHRHIRMLRADVLPHVGRFNDALVEARIPLTVLPGSEIQAYDSDLYRLEFEAGLYCHLGDSDAFTLLEFPWDPRRYPADAPDLIHWIKSRGMTPIVAHPERVKLFRDDPGKLRELTNAGAWLQLTVDSFLGNHGEMAELLSHEVMGNYTEIVIATDTHNLNRCSGLSAGYRWVRENYGPEREADLRARADAILKCLLPAEPEALATAS